MIDVMIITYNEAVNLPRSLAALRGWVTNIFVIDSGSTDGTQAIAREYGAKVIQHDWEGYARQKNWGLANLPFESPWILILDADEIVTAKVRTRVTDIVTKQPDDVHENGFFINRLTYFLGKPIRHCGYYPSWNLRLFKRGAGRYEDRQVHEHMVIDRPLGYIREPILHADHRGLEHYFAKHNRYSSLEAQAFFRDARDGDSDESAAKPSLTTSTRINRWLKHHCLPWLPFSGFWRFLYMYVFRLGFLDGKAGWAFCRFIAMYDSMFSLKLNELRRQAASGGLSNTPPALALPEGAWRPQLPVQIMEQTQTDGQEEQKVEAALERPTPDSAEQSATERRNTGMDMPIIGLSVYHGDAAAAGILNGRFITGVEEERFKRIKHWAGFPREAMRHCLQEVAGGDPGALRAIAVARQPGAHFLRKVAITATHPRSLIRAVGRLKAISKIKQLEATIAEALGVPAEMIPNVYNVEHHLSHIASAFFCSPFEEAACLTVDGFGDFVSTMRAVGRGNNIEPLDRVYYPDSLGMFYTAVTQFLGFGHYGDEYKVMGLAAYGEPSLVDKVGQLVPKLDDGRFRLDQRYFRHLREGVDMIWDDGEPHLGTVFSQAMEQLLGQPPRHKDEPLTQWHKDLAASVQHVYEDRFFTLVRSLQKSTGLNRLALAGGCALNSLANGRLLQQTDTTEIYIQAAAGDAGTSLGAALYAHHSILGQPREFVMEHAYWGPQYSDEEIRRAIANRIPESGGGDGAFGQYAVQTHEDEAQLLEETATAITEGQVIGWYQGRSEWGPRALGNRSILADPRRADIREILNAKIKRRELFRPFAPSILEERTGEWFTISYPDPFMLKVYPIQPDKRDRIPAITHADGTGRVQTVSEKTNARYYRLISAFERMTGVPILLNTSFNENEPIVNTPAEALDCFMRTKMDRLVMGNVVVRREHAGESVTAGLREAVS